MNVNTEIKDAWSVVSYNDSPRFSYSPSVTVWYQTNDRDDADHAAEVFNKQNPNCERVVTGTWLLLK